jgi:A/G-specific adenine glycosylase
MAFKDLLIWFKNNHRILPFRQTSSPYQIWVAEIMLQQTQVITMLPYYERFIQRFKTITSLGNATFEEVLPYVTGLGYYRRFRLMHQTAQIVLNEYKGEFPNTYASIKALPGIGDYTAGAIMSIAYKKPYSALDGNVMRVLTRLFMIHDDIRKNATIKRLNELNQSLIDHKEPDIYTHAMMELGATICKPVRPKCDICPLQEICQSYEHQTQASFPYKSKATSKKHIKWMTCIIYNEHNAYVLKKETQSLFEGMYLFLQVESESVVYTIEWLLEQGIHVEHESFLNQTKHVFTHQVWEMDVHVFKLKHMDQKKYFLATKEDPKFKMMPTAHLKIYKLLK